MLPFQQQCENNQKDEQTPSILNKLQHHPYAILKFITKSAPPPHSHTTKRRLCDRMKQKDPRGAIS